jgi:hypothetical protein
MAEGSVEKKYFVPGLMVKLLGAIGVGVIYKFYYIQGDTLAYFEAGLLLNEYFWRSPLTYFQILFSDFDSFIPYFPEIPYIYGAGFLKGESTLIISKISAVFSFLCFDSYLSTALLFAFFSYSGIWALFKIFIRIYPQLKKEMAIAVLFIPSVFFWGSGILKDSITISAIGWIVYGVYYIFFLRKRLFLSFVMILFWGNLLAIAKIYVLAAILPPLVLWLVFGLLKSNSNPYRKSLLTGGVLAIFLVGFALYSNQLAQKIQETAIENVLKEALVSAHWNATGYTNSSSSAYEIDFKALDVNNPGSFFSILPKTISISLYRPFLWEANKVIILLAAIENFFFLWMSIRLFIKRNPFRVFKTLFADPNLIFFLSFVFIFSFVVGLSSGVYGALVRYKIPMLPFFVATLFVLYDATRKQ